MTVIATVLKSGGEYHGGHVLRLHRQLGELPAVCLSDMPVPGVGVIPLAYGWPGWFSKMELFNPALIRDDILYLDLDTVITGEITAYLRDCEFRMLSDFYHPERPASGVMFIPHHAKVYIWEQWMQSPEHWMATRRGDQDVLESICGRDVARFGRGICSWKAHVAGPGMPGWNARFSRGNGQLPVGTDILCFHGRPRPWEVPEAMLLNESAHR